MIKVVHEQFPCENWRFAQSPLMDIKKPCDLLGADTLAALATHYVRMKETLRPKNLVLIRVLARVSSES